MRAVISMILSSITQGLTNKSNQQGQQGNKKAQQRLSQASKGLSFFRRLGRF
ncbi:hypothetical protein IV417_06355 [Alphaproteobacteria bacterium KMM 3653]|uniref:Uncharacterized protein n=1 Tax=Harenicola maris TaxID=2841044 RepID=A0AAP2G3N6_9RHOB|nr:hypothetical protein [Harenicola maris]